MRLTKKEKIITFLALLLAITVGYALLSQILNINGTTNIKKTTWSIIWDNVVVKEGSVTPTQRAQITNTEKTLPEYLTYSVTYSDGKAIEAKHLLKSGSKETYKVRVEFEDVSADKLPSSEETLKFKFSVDYVQADNTGVEVDHGLTGVRYTTNTNNSVWIGQIHVYMNYIDQNLKNINQDKTIGIIIVEKNNKFIMEYCSDDRIMLRKYQLI